MAPAPSGPLPLRLGTPERGALLVAGAYTVGFGVWVFLSSQAAARLSPSVADLAWVEAFKGVAFVVVTGGMLFAWSLLLLRRVARMTAALEAQRNALVASERKVVAGLLASTVAHDFANLLTVAHASADELEERFGPESGPANQQLQAALDRMGELVTRLRTATRGDGPARPVPLGALVRDATALARLHPQLRQIPVEVQVGDVGTIDGHPGMLTQLIVNLLVNAGEATDGLGRVSVGLYADGDVARLEVEDNGPGLPEEAPQQVFDPFFTTKPTGTGLGLVSVKAAAQAHGGTVRAGPSALGGARFTVLLPGLRAA